MNAEQYRAVINWFQARPAAQNALRLVSRGSVALVYLGYLGFVIRPLGLALAVLAVVIAVCRVVTGVHYISDVLAGLAFGAVFAVVGWNAFVLAASAVGFYAIMLL